MKTVIEEQSTDKTKGLEAHVVADNGFLSVEIEGCNNCGIDDSAPLGTGVRCVASFEIWQGELRLLVWADINQEDPTHVISLEGAKITARTCEYCGGSCPADIDHACDGFIGDIDGLYEGHI